MRNAILIFGTAIAALSLMSCASDGAVEVCGPATFEMTPQGAAPYNIIDRTVCFHSQQEIDGCPIWNYRIPPSEDFSEYIDIFYGGECTRNDLDGAFFVELSEGEQYRLSGTPAGPPPSRPRPELMGSGNYTKGDELGTFRLFWIETEP